MTDSGRNTGDCNTGDCNTGDCNTGHWNTGDFNTGHCNTGDFNTGHCNTGNCNTGDCNTGDCNTGDCNTGDCNTGDCNTGDCNTGNRNTGYFCVNDGPVIFFDMPVAGMTREQAADLIPYMSLPTFSCDWVATADMTDAEKSANPSHATTGGFLRKYDLTIQQSLPLAWAKMNNETRQRFLDLPNFDAEKFLKCTGVDVRTTTPEKVTPQTIVIDGKTYRLVEA